MLYLCLRNRLFPEFGGIVAVLLNRRTAECRIVEVFHYNVVIDRIKQGAGVTLGPAD
jgi:hypothetical protein